MTKCSQEIADAQTRQERTCKGETSGRCRFCQGEFCTRHMGDRECSQASTIQWGRHTHVTQEAWEAMGEIRLQRPRKARVKQTGTTIKPVEVTMTVSVLLPDRWHLHNIRETPGNVVYLGPGKGCMPDERLEEWLARQGSPSTGGVPRWPTLGVAGVRIREVLEQEHEREKRNREE